ncbi:uncharacterized protein BJ212DRAFT_1484322 [Suillus subaureus]|uniref:Fungal-type protein kinase domain-containing protein n=1 Tax=Suillus subaureus TaxID=48587 RepID=A0A9P7E2V5_9AGAM|nr:uncharacterized protein BJ212DRAFT_1484322 [Suillus subaureus]KAG1809621.1 hypothetical protein BJ212DRAFT_1484322 [Suillus subaureus]
MDKLLEEEFIGTVLWEEKSLPKDAKSVMDTLILQTNFTPASLNKIYYFKSGPRGKRVKSGSIFQPAAHHGMNAEWLFDNRNVQPKLLVDSRKQKKRVQMSMALAMLTNTEVEILDSSFTMPETDKSFGAKGYNNKHPSKKQPQASATTEGKWTLLFNIVQAAMHMMYKKIFPNPSTAFPFGAMNIISGPPKCIWSSQFCNTPIPDNTNAQKPDIILTSDGTEYALKDCWVTKDKKNHEVTILKMVEGILNVVKLVAHWDVLYNGEPDCTYRIQASHGVCTSGEPLVFYSSKLELLRAFHDFVSAHSLMLTSHVLHGDLSPNNFIIHDGQGYFIDFDHACIIVEGTVSVPSEGTGTRPYMSICLLREGIAKGATIQHTASDDLESLFFIFVEFATTFNGPCGFMKDEGRRPLWVDKFEISGADPWLAKQGYVLAPHNDSSLMEKTTSFFTPFSQIIQEWHHLILAAASDPSDPPPPPIGITHAALAVLLKKWISQLPVDAPTEIMVPMASSSRLGHPPHDDVQSSAGACCSMCIQQRVS